jgi:hypothetical protein
MKWKAEATTKENVKIGIVMIFIPIIFIWFSITKLIEWNYFLLSNITNWCDSVNTKITNKADNFIWGRK